MKRHFAAFVLLWANLAFAAPGLEVLGYRLKAAQFALPNFNAISPDEVMMLPNLDVTGRDSSMGFPGLLGSWNSLFGLRIRGYLEVPATDSYEFLLMCDDGARLYIDGVLVINNDGAHAPFTLPGTIFLSQGSHSIMVDYHQAGGYLALQLYWRNYHGGFEIIEPKSFSH